MVDLVKKIKKTTKDAKTRKNMKTAKPRPQQKQKPKKKSIHSKDYLTFLQEDVHGQGFKGMGKYFKRKLTPKPKKKK